MPPGAPPWGLKEAGRANATRAPRQAVPSAALEDDRNPKTPEVLGQEGCKQGLQIFWGVKGKDGKKAGIKKTNSADRAE